MIKMTQVASWRAIAASALFAVAVTPAKAQELEAGTVEIIVTAQGREERLKDVPISASVMSGASLAESGLKNLQDITQRMPAVKITPAPAGDLLNVRGIGSGINAGFEQSVATFVDGIYRGRARSSRAALFDIDRVEILKGPQTTFFGNNAIAGALSIATRRAAPGGELSYNAGALYSPTDGEFDLNFGLSAPLGDTLGIRIAAKYFGMDGYVRNTFINEDGPHLRDFTGRVSVAWSPSDIWRSDLRFDYGRFRDNNFFPTQVLNCPPTSQFVAVGQCARYLATPGAIPLTSELKNVNASGPSRSNLDYYEIALSNELDTGSHAIKTLTAYYDHDSDSLAQLIPLPLPGIGGTNSPFPGATPETYNAFSQELRISSNTGGFLEYMAGAYFAASDLTTGLPGGFYFAPFGAFAPGFTTPATPIAGVVTHKEKNKTYSAFGSFTAHFTDQLRLNGGLRYSIVNKKAFRDFFFGIGGNDPSKAVRLPDGAQALLQPVLGGKFGNFSDPDRTDRQLMPSLSLQYDLNPSLMTYVSFTQGFKAGGFGVSLTGDTFESEKVDAYEAGIKGSLFGNRLQFGIAVFRSLYRDLQETTNVPLPNGVSQILVSNAGKARSQGIEFNASIRVSDVLSLTGDVSYLDAKYTSYPNAPCTALQLAQTPANCSQDLAGSPRPYAPKFSGNIGASFKFPIGNAVLRIDPGMYFSSSYYQQATIDPQTLQPKFAKFDLRASIGDRDHGWEIAVIGRNLTNQYTGSFRSSSLATSPSSNFVLLDRPRSVAVQFTIKR